MREFICFYIKGRHHTSLSLRMVGFCAEELIRSGEFSSVPPYFPLDFFLLQAGGYTVRFPNVFKVVINGSDKWSKLLSIREGTKLPDRCQNSRVS